MTEVIRYKKGEGAVIQFIDWSHTEVHALGRPAIGDLLCACLDRPFVCVEFRLFEFDKDKVKPNGTATQLKAVVTATNEVAADGSAVRWRPNSKVSSIKGYGITKSMTCLGYKAARMMIAGAVEMAKPGDRIAILVEEANLPEKEGKRSPKRITIQRMI